MGRGVYSRLDGARTLGPVYFAPRTSSPGNSPRRRRIPALRGVERGERRAMVARRFAGRGETEARVLGERAGGRFRVEPLEGRGRRGDGVAAEDEGLGRVAQEGDPRGPRGRQ